jgi:preprotein translocase subunit SecA
MGFNDFLGKILGNKSQRDLKEITPYVDKIKAVYSEIASLSNDDLRARTETIKIRIQDYVSVEVSRVAELKASIEETEIDLREKIYTEVDKLEKEITAKYEEILDEVLPEAFSIMKDTARRLTENSELIVTANDFDRDLATRFDFVTIQGDKAHYKNEWTAGGTLIK